MLFSRLTYGFQMDYETLGEIKLKPIPLSLDEFNLNQNTIFPNRSSNFITIKTTQKADEIVIFNLLSQISSKPKLINNSINVSTLSKGVYLLNIKRNNTEIAKKIIIK